MPKKKEVIDFKVRFLLMSNIKDRIIPDRNRNPKTIPDSEINARRSPKRKKYLNFGSFWE